MLLTCWNFLCFLPFPSLLSPGILESKNKAGFNPRAQPALYGAPRPISNPQEGHWNWKQPGGSLGPTHGWTLGAAPAPNQAKMCICYKTTFISPLSSTSSSPGLAPKYKLLSNVCSGDHTESNCRARTQLLELHYSYLDNVNNNNLSSLGQS